MDSNQTNRQRPLKWLAAVLAIAAVIGFYLFDADHYLSLAGIKEQHQLLQGLYHQQPALVAACFFLLYTAAAALSIPAAGLLTLLAGSVFGFGSGLLLASFASSLGATLAFSIARWLLGERIRHRFASQLPRFSQGFADEGAFYLFALRLVPLFPFFTINLVMALLPIRLWTFYWVSQVGMLAGTALYVYAGQELAEVEQLTDIASPGLIAAFVLLGLAPIASKKLVDIIRARGAS